MDLSDFSHWARGNGLEICLFAIGAVLLARAVHWGAGRYLDHLNQAGRVQIDETGVASERNKRYRALVQAADLGVVALVYFVAALLILDKFGLPLTSLVAPATVAGVAIGFGAQQIVGDVLAGFFLLTEHQFGVGDVVQLAQPGQTAGVRGTVEELTLRVTKLRTAQGELIFLPNSALRQVTNLSREWSRVVIDVPIPVDQDLDAATKVVRDAAESVCEDPAWRDAILGEPVVAGVESIEVDHLQLRLVARTLPGKQFDVARVLRLRIARALQHVGVSTATGQPVAHAEG
ncbi:MAG TPA: mechanosensitive ion channel family protein [Acidimicrobiia bacterium]|nr:mechanosensitive ion channel family protein [Acidimicrobiia bacterium]